MATNALLPNEQQIVACTLSFANLRPIASAEEVERPFEKIKKSFPIGFQTKPLAYYQNLQPQVLRWLERIVSEGKTNEEKEMERRKVAVEIGRPLLDVHAYLLFSKRKLQLDYRITDVMTGCLVGIALILDESRGQVDRLQRCGYSNCRLFNFDFNPRGRPRKFCSQDHKRRFDNETSWKRQKTFRSKSA